MKEYFLVIMKLLFLDTMKTAEGHDFVCVYMYVCMYVTWMHIWLGAEEGFRA